MEDYKVPGNYKLVAELVREDGKDKLKFVWIKNKEEEE